MVGFGDTRTWVYLVLFHCKHTSIGVLKIWACPTLLDDLRGVRERHSNASLLFWTISTRGGLLRIV